MSLHPRHTVLSGLEPLVITPELNFINVASAQCQSSAQFRKMVKEGASGRRQSGPPAVENGGRSRRHMDEGLTIGAHGAFTQPDRLGAGYRAHPVWSIRRNGRASKQASVPDKARAGQPISLKEARKNSSTRAQVMRYGPRCDNGFDEEARPYLRSKVAIARALSNHQRTARFSHEDIIFDPNHIRLARIEENKNTRRLHEADTISAALPHCHVSGVSRMSHSSFVAMSRYGGNPCGFLYHAIRAGMDWACQRGACDHR